MGARLSAGDPPGPPAGYAAATSDPARGVGGERRWSPSPADRTVPAGLGSSSLAVGNVSVASPRRPAPPPPRPTVHPGAAPSTHHPRLTAATTRTSVTNAGPSRSSNITTAFPATREVSGEGMASTAPGGVTVSTASDSRDQINGRLEAVQIQTWQLQTRFALLLTGIDIFYRLLFFVFSEFSTWNYHGLDL